MGHKLGPMCPTNSSRRFLFLQGPHGPFFWRLGQALCAAGCSVTRIGLNAGDRLFWPESASYVPYRGVQDDFRAWLSGKLDKEEITDLVLYGEVRPHHRDALELAREKDITTHIFEEGYLRPYWVTYERSGTNGHSRLLETGLDTMRAVGSHPPHPARDVPAHWGAMRQHIFYGALYHAPLLLPSRQYPGYMPHRDISVRREAALHLRQLALMPFARLSRALATSRLKRRAVAYHLCLLQLDHDASVRAHSGVGSTEEFVNIVLEGFAKGAPPHHHLVFKAHPLEDGRVPLARLIRGRAHALGLAERVHFLTGGKLAHLLDGARSAVTINSTAAQQALWRGLPVKTFGLAVYSRPELVSNQPIGEFFATPTAPDMGAYLAFRSYLLATCQYQGSYYSAAGRRVLLPRIVDAILEKRDPFQCVNDPGAATVQHLAVVR